MASSPIQSRRRLVGFSTKMYFSFAETTSYISTLLSLLSDLTPNQIASLQNTDIFILPDHISLTTVISQLRSFFNNTCPIFIKPGAQDAFYKYRGAFTGEVSPSVLAEIGCHIVEVGHAERRQHFGETDETTALKAAAVAAREMAPLVCVGETTKPAAITPSDPEILDTKSALAEITVQVQTALQAVPVTSDVIIAYEPVWAIGSSAPATPSYVIAIAQAIRNIDCVRWRGIGSTWILYGGSAGPGLFEKLKGSVDGLFLGRFAHDPKQFVKTILEVATA
ncbi:triosephosphate isomerase [Xylaria nigripes]|nr:triosephosphate isomerase [Xylaria nigripes]